MLRVRLVASVLLVAMMSGPFAAHALAQDAGGAGDRDALAALYDFGRDINRLGPRSNAGNLAKAKEDFQELAAVLGLEPVSTATSDGEVEPLIQLLVNVRSQLRKQRVWDVSDHIRDELAKLGVTLEDGPASTTWRRS